MRATRPGNHILSAIAARDLALLQPHLEAVPLPLRESLEQPNKPVRHIYFPENGIVSVVAEAPGNRKIESGIIGREGMTGLPVVMGDDRSPNATFVQVSGSARRLAATRLREAMQESATLRSFLLRFAQAFTTQATHTALANGRAKIEERLARWLLMSHDRMDGDELPLTHEFLAVMLGVRRAGVTIVVRILEERGLISARRGLIVVRDRKGLRNVAGAIYGIPEAEYGRLLGWHSRQ